MEADGDFEGLLGALVDSSAAAAGPGRSGAHVAGDSHTSHAESSAAAAAAALCRLPWDGSAWWGVFRAARAARSWAGTKALRILAMRSCLATIDEALAGAHGVSRAFPSWNRSILAEIYLCHACSYQEILRTEHARTGGHTIGRPTCGGGTAPAGRGEDGQAHSR
jgi:hypothetical protein